MSHVSIFRVSAPASRLVSLPKQPQPVPPRAGVCYAYRSAGCRDFAHSREWSEGCRGSQGSPLPVSRRQPAVPSRLSHTSSYVQRTAFSSVSACRRWSASVASVASMRLLKPAASILNHKQQRSRAPTSDARAAKMSVGRGCGIARPLGSLCRCTGAGDVLSNNAGSWFVWWAVTSRHAKDGGALKLRQHGCQALQGLESAKGSGPKRDEAFRDRQARSA
jgi:hypothetical protein